MRTVLVKPLAIVIAVVALIALAPIPMGKILGPRPVPIGNAGSGDVTLLLLGDSIALQYAAYLSEALGDCADVYLLMRPGTQTVRQYVTAPAWKFANVGDSSRFRRNMGEWVEKRDFDVIVANVGIHDVRREDGSFSSVVDEDRYRNNLGNILSYLKQRASNVFYVLTTPVFEEYSGLRLTALVDSLNAAAVEVSSSLGVDVLVVPEGLEDGAEKYLRPDGVHLTDAGAEYFVETISGRIKQKVCRNEVGIER